MNQNFPLNITKIAFDILQQISTECQKTADLTDEDFIAIHSVFGSVFERATEILEKSNVITFYKLDNGTRTIAEVKGNSDRAYKIIPGVNFCPCSAFQFQVLKSKSELTCKHILAVWLAKVLNKYCEQNITQQQYLSVICSIYMTDINQE